MLIDPYPAHWQDHLAAQHAALSGGRRLILLIDGAFVPDLYRAVRKVSPDTDKVHLLFEHLPACTDATRAISPFVVPYAPTTGLKHVLDRCSGWPMVSSIETPEAVAAVAARLAAWCIVENDRQRFNCRYPDTRRLPGLFAALSAAQQATLAGPARRWSYIGRDGNWSELALPGQAGPVAEQPSLDDARFAAMVADSEVDETIVLLRDRGPLPDDPPSRTYARVDAARRSAARHGFAPDHYLDWCEHCLRGGAEPDDAAALAWRAAKERQEAE